ncbi:hypothetical protein MNR01_12850 [Lysobacter sp. S4-A87]|uniref:hypothetical protein n=1 Tax=Lysobacter sp. S4-A87 TaxID=2925843 RepID=UPI001F534A58|nr:hypothetical protein [Lysobacter sp. S4-A87]UNK48632.1 hypothetical protein MNR01_12850 [Lysobacter sp. S4-A87]
MNLPRQDRFLPEASHTDAAASGPDAETIGPGLDDLLRHAVAIGAVLVLLLPAARGFSDTFGWMPLWLLVMPLCAWWALHRFRLPANERDTQAQPRPRRRIGEQARRRRPASPRRKHSQAA